MPKMVCFKCEVELVIEKSGVPVIEYFSDPPQPYQIFDADAWKCPKCGVVIVAGFGEIPLAEHYEDRFNSFLEGVKNTHTAKTGWLVNDYEWPPIS